MLKKMVDQPLFFLVVLAVVLTSTLAVVVTVSFGADYSKIS